MKRVMWTSCVVALLAACGGDSDTPPTVAGPRQRDSGPDEERDSGTRDSGTRDSGTRDSGGPDAGQLGPVLEFLGPPPTQDPNDEAVLTANMVKARCRATQREGGNRVDNSSITISMDKAPGSTERIKGAVSALPDAEFEASFELGSRENGPVSFFCTAKDLSTPPFASSTSMTTLLDLGPAIEVSQPKHKMSYALTKPVAIEFRVDPAPIGENDAKAAVTAVTLQVGGVEIPAAESGQTKGLYQTSVNFADTSLFPVPPSSAEVLIAAKNDRGPSPPTRTVKLDIGVDGEGPAISVASPQNLSMQHGEVTLVLSITDPSGVDAGSVRAVIKGSLPTGDLVIERWNRSGNTYSQTFDTRRFIPTLNEVTINIYATDIVGNSAEDDHQLRLDNRPPVLSLDPSPIREWRMDNKGYYCSEPFDPVGDWATNDRQTVPAAALFRVLVEDRTNTVPGALYIYYAGVATDKVQLFAQPDPSIPLLIDSEDEDNECDQINFDALPIAQKPAVLTLKPLTPRGTAHFSTTDLSLQLPFGPTCTEAPNGSSSPPAAFCTPGTEMFRALPGRSDAKPAAVYAVNPTNGSAGPCEGDTWTIGSTLGEGWACVAARAADTIGNVGVSEPIRVCVDDGEDPPPPCALGEPEANSPPSCVQDCQFGASQRFGVNEFWRQQ